MAANTRILIGKIVAAHGIRGLVKVQPFVEDEALLNGPLFTKPTGDATITLKLGKPMAQVWLASVDGVTERNGAEALRGTELWIERDGLPAIEEDGTFYIADLIGLRVIDKERGEIGVVTGVENFGAGDLLDIQPMSGASFYLPFTQDVLGSVDLAKRQINVAIPEGLLDS